MDYPVFDEGDYFERENEARTGFAEAEKPYMIRSLIKHLELTDDYQDNEELGVFAYSLIYEYQHYCGEKYCPKPDDNSFKDAVNEVVINHFHEEFNSFLEYFKELYELGREVA